jgi:hypothetical protein
VLQRERREQQALQQVQREQQLPEQRREQQLPEQRREQQLPEPEQQRQALQRGQQLLLFCRKRSWKQPAEQPGERNISFDFPLLTNIKTHTRDRSGTCDPADARILANQQKKTTIYLKIDLAKTQRRLIATYLFLPGISLCFDEFARSSARTQFALIDKP